VAMLFEKMNTSPKKKNVFPACMWKQAMQAKRTGKPTTPTT